MQKKDWEIDFVETPKSKEIEAPVKNKPKWPIHPSHFKRQDHMYV